tara:strand:- start:181 stop:456 length:276 start_codon:yes stop_codon:yes gene_type:complete
LPTKAAQKAITAPRWLTIIIAVVPSFIVSIIANLLPTRPRIPDTTDTITATGKLALVCAAIIIDPVSIFTLFVPLFAWFQIATNKAVSTSS